MYKNGLNIDTLFIWNIGQERSICSFISTRQDWIRWDLFRKGTDGHKYAKQVLIWRNLCIDGPDRHISVQNWSWFDEICGRMVHSFEVLPLQRWRLGGTHLRNVHTDYICRKVVWILWKIYMNGPDRDTSEHNRPKWGEICASKAPMGYYTIDPDW